MLQERLGAAQGLPIRGGREREVGHGVNVHGLHVEHDALDWHAEDLGLGERGHVVLVQRGRVQPVAVSWAGTTGTTGTLGCRRLGDPPNRKGLYAAGVVVLSLLGAAAVDDVAYAGDSERRLGNVGRDDDETVALGRRLEHLHLLILREERVERKHSDGHCVSVGRSS